MSDFIDLGPVIWPEPNPDEKYMELLEENQFLMRENELLRAELAEMKKKKKSRKVRKVIDPKL